MIWKTVKAVIWDQITPFYISMEDGSVYHILQVKDPYENRNRIEYEEVKDISNLDLDCKLDLWIVTDEQYEQLSKEQELRRDRENQERKDNIKKFKTLVDELDMSLDPEAMKLLRDHKSLL